MLAGLPVSLWQLRAHMHKLVAAVVIIQDSLYLELPLKYTVNRDYFRNITWEWSRITTEISGSTIVSTAIISYPHPFSRTSHCRPSSAHVATVPCTFSTGGPWLTVMYAPPALLCGTASSAAKFRVALRRLNTTNEQDNTIRYACLPAFGNYSRSWVE